MHPDVIGAIPGREGLEVAWGAQAFLEISRLFGFPGALSTYDFKTYFDAFNHKFTFEMMLHVGMPEKLARLTYQLYQKHKRVLTKGKAQSEEFTAYNGVGQGDILSLIPAMVFVSWQFKMMDQLYPQVEKGAYFEDRNFRGTIEQLIQLDADLHAFDQAAGHSTQPEKTEFAVVNKKCKENSKRRSYKAASPKSLHT